MFQSTSKYCSGKEENFSFLSFILISFCKKSIEDVKQFLMKYCSEQNIAGYVMVPDPLATYYEALCVGLEWDDDVLLGDFIDLNFQPSPTNSGWFATCCCPLVNIYSNSTLASKFTLVSVHNTAFHGL